MAATWTEFRRNRERDAQQDINAGNFGAPQVEEVAQGIPVNNDAALNAHLKETRDKSAEYARLQTEADRQIWEQAVSNNFRRDQQFANEQKTQAAVEKMNRESKENIEKAQLLSEYESINASLPFDKDGKPLPVVNDWTVDKDKLRAAAINADRIKRATGVDFSDPEQVRAQQQQNNSKLAQTFPDGQPVHVTQNQDGTMTVEYVTGERFTGDPLTVTQQIGKSHVETKRWAQQQRAQQPQPPAQPTAQPTQSTTEQSTLADYWAKEQADAIAKQFGFSDKTEMQQWGENVNQRMAKVQEFEEWELAGRFHAANPDFPDTVESSNALLQIIESNGWQTNLQSLQAAHALALRSGLYEPLTPEMQQAARGIMPTQNRPVPPPILRGSNPEISQSAPSPYEMSMQDLRKAAIKQELERNSPGYR